MTPGGRILRMLRVIAGLPDPHALAADAESEKLRQERVANAASIAELLHDDPIKDMVKDMRAQWGKYRW